MRVPPSCIGAGGDQPPTAPHFEAHIQYSSGKYLSAITWQRLISRGSSGR
jgi:hypothetical protein